MSVIKRIDQKLVCSEGGIMRRRPDGRLTPFAPPIRIEATISVEGLPDKFVAIKFIDYRKKVVSIKLPRGDFLTFHKFKHAVEDAGYDFPRDDDDGKELHEFIIDLAPKEQWHFVDRSGWHGKEFVLQNLPARNGVLKLLLETDKPLYCACFEKRGTLSDWQQQVARHALHSRRMVFLTCLAFAAPLMRLVGVESGGFHLFGGPITGKSILLMVASSVVGPGICENLPNWDLVDEALEEVAVGHNDSLLCLGETGHIRTDGSASVAKRLRANAFKLAGGRGRLRNSRRGQRLSVRESKWCLLFLSMGELALSGIASEADMERVKGEEIRVIDVPVVKDENLGVYENLPPGCASLTEATEAITKACKANSGVAFECYLDHLKHNLGRLDAMVALDQDRFMRTANVPTDAWERRFAQRFALAFAAGAIAADSGVVPWNRPSIGEAVSFCYRIAREALPDVHKLHSDGLAILRTKLRDDNLILDLKHSGHNVSWTADQAQKAQVFRRSDGGGTQFIVAPSTFEQWYRSKLQSELVLRELESQGLLSKSRRGLRTMQISIAGIPGKGYYYCISERLLSRSNNHIGNRSSHEAAAMIGVAGGGTATRIGKEQQ